MTIFRGEAALAKRMRNITWLIFIIAKGKEVTFSLLTFLLVRLLHRCKSLAELAFMLVACFLVVAKYCPTRDLLTCDVLESTHQ